MSGKRSSVTLLATVALGALALTATGCGAPMNSTARTAALQRSMVNLNLAQDKRRITSDIAGRSRDLRPATEEYIADLRRASQVLGKDTVRASLMHMANDLRLDCQACAEMLDREATRTMTPALP